ncbi:MAG: N-acetylmuramoyl-L-alanine amidase [Bacteroidales bacterium]|nr:N-acetylmuramoyl-L-alanine amidase [Bacteroidales bacterium]
MKLVSSYSPRHLRPAIGGYRYFFNGQEADNEVLGEGALHAFEYRMHDTRIGRFWSVDPLAGKFPWNSTYAFAENMPTWARELEGLEADVNANDNRVAIDPGHGIKGTKNSKVDSGAVGNDFYEKDITLSISESVNKHLSEWGLETTMTRTGDLTIDQEQISYRISVAHDFDADLFVSIHTNSTTNPDVRGFLVCYNPNNKINGENSQLLAESIVSSQSIVPIFNNGLQPRDKLGVLNQFKGTASVLVEVGFISNNNDVLLMTQNADEIGREIALGVYKYLYNKEPSPPVQPSLKMPELMYPITPQDNLKIGNNPMGGW